MLIMSQHRQYHHTVHSTVFIMSPHHPRYCVHHVTTPPVSLHHQCHRTVHITMLIMPPHRPKKCLIMPPHRQYRHTAHITMLITSPHQQYYHTFHNSVWLHHHTNSITTPSIIVFGYITTPTVLPHKTNRLFFLDKHEL